MMKKILMAGMLAACMSLGGCGGNAIRRVEGAPKEDVGGRFLCDNNNYRFETVTDTKTGVVYLVWKGGAGSSSKGGITVLVNEDGTPVTSEEVEGE